MLVHRPNEIPFLKQPCLESKRAFNEACESGNAKMLKTLENIDKCDINNARSVAAKCGNEEAFLWLSDLNNERSEKFCEMAAEGGHFKLAKKLYRGRRDLINEHGLTRAGARYGNINFLKWMKKKNMNVDIGICGSSALKYGQLELLKWLKTKKWKSNQDSCNDAAKSGRIELVQWAKDNGSDWGEKTMQRMGT